MKCHYLPKSPQSVLKVVLVLGVALAVLARGSRPASGNAERAPPASATQPSTIHTPGVERGTADGPSGCKQRRGIIPDPPAPPSNPPAPSTPGSGPSSSSSPPGDGGVGSA